MLQSSCWGRSHPLCEHPSGRPCLSRTATLQVGSSLPTHDILQTQSACKQPWRWHCLPAPWDASDLHPGIAAVVL